MMKPESIWRAVERGFTARDTWGLPRSAQFYQHCRRRAAAWLVGWWIAHAITGTLLRDTRRHGAFNASRDLQRERARRQR